MEYNLSANKNFSVFIYFKEAFNKVCYVAPWAIICKCNIDANLANVTEKKLVAIAVILNDRIRDWFRKTV